MTGYIIKRLFMIIPILLGVATIVFILMFLVPGDPARLLMGQHGDEKVLESIRREMGLDKPVYIQYVRFIGKLLKGDLGKSYRQASRAVSTSRRPLSPRSRPASLLMRQNELAFGFG